MCWIDPAHTNLAVRQAVDDGLWYSTDALCHNTVVLHGPYKTLDDAKNATEMLVQLGEIEL